MNTDVTKQLMATPLFMMVMHTGLTQESALVFVMTYLFQQSTERNPEALQSSVPYPF